MDDLERAGAFVVALDARRSWVRYDHLFAGLLQLELRRTRPGEVAALHGAAARWCAAHGSSAEPVLNNPRRALAGEFPPPDRDREEYERPEQRQLVPRSLLTPGKSGKRHLSLVVTVALRPREWTHRKTCSLYRRSQQPRA